MTRVGHGVSVQADGTAFICGVPVRGTAADGLSGSFTLRAQDDHLRIQQRTGDAGPPGVIWLQGGQVTEMLPAGDHAEHMLRLGENPLFASIPTGTHDFRPGEVVEIGHDAVQILFYGDDGGPVRDWSRVG